MELDEEMIDVKRERVLAILAETNLRRKTSLKEVADYIASKEISKKKEEVIRELERLKKTLLI